MTEPKIIDKGLRFIGPLQKRTRTDYIVLHHPAAVSCTIEDIHRWHQGAPNFWLGCGYHLFCRKDGSIYAGRPLDTQGAHCKNHNDRSIGICAEGDFTKEQMPAEQEQALVDVIAWLLARYPGATVKRHSDLNATTCPGPNFPFDRIVAAAQPGTPILGPARATVEQAQAWARSRGATEQFVGLAPLYWKYGQLYGIRPEVLYCQAAKETAFGRFGGAVTPDMHNFAGIKVLSPKSDRREDHETFPDDDTGVHAHYQHVGAYVGIAPIGPKTHPRQDLVRSLPWAGTIRYAEELGGRWAPSPDYGRSIVRDCLQPLLATPVPQSPQPEPAEETVPLAEYRRVVDELELLREKIDRIREIVA